MFGRTRSSNLKLHLAEMVMSAVIRLVIPDESSKTSTANISEIEGAVHVLVSPLDGETHDTNGTYDSAECAVQLPNSYHSLCKLRIIDKIENLYIRQCNADVCHGKTGPSTKKRPMDEKINICIQHWKIPREKKTEHQLITIKYLSQVLQTDGMEMGSSLSPFIANIFMESFEQEALSKSSSPPKAWLRYVDDTFLANCYPTNVIKQQKKPLRPLNPKETEKPGGILVIPYVQSISEKSRRPGNKYGLRTAFRSKSTVKRLPDQELSPDTPEYEPSDNTRNFNDEELFPCETLRMDVGRSPVVEDNGDEYLQSYGDHFAQWWNRMGPRDMRKYIKGVKIIEEVKLEKTLEPFAFSFDEILPRIFQDEDNAYTNATILEEFSNTFRHDQDVGNVLSEYTSVTKIKVKQLSYCQKPDSLHDGYSRTILYLEKNKRTPKKVLHYTTRKQLFGKLKEKTILRDRNRPDEKHSREYDVECARQQRRLIRNIILNASENYNNTMEYRKYMNDIMDLLSKSSNMSYEVCFAMTQERTLKFAGVDLRQDCFSRSQFYLACLRGYERQDECQDDLPVNFGHSDFAVKLCLQDRSSNEYQEPMRVKRSTELHRNARARETGDPEKTHRPVASSVMIHRRESNPVRLGRRRVLLSATEKAIVYLVDHRMACSICSRSSYVHMHIYRHLKKAHICDLDYSCVIYHQLFNKHGHHRYVWSDVNRRSKFYGRKINHLFGNT
ncbi:hypothetical protein PR048_015818 [Dryococelus australis]|uniref:Reverse transcriptase domain-containing protein n=1 Tax=Dryococelus australis TaxID=614101 RepID=A0ABQ9HI02_9NEOP|nr:hypothetical protein PR048_015818 [Dryococelus australis]